MARIRSVKPQLRTSFTVASWPREVRYFWVLLWGYLDDRGRGIDDPRLIKSDCFPLDDDVTWPVVDDWIALIAKTPEEDSDLPTLCRYQVRGRRYVHAPKWTDHQKPQYVKESELPECPLHDSVENSEDSQKGSEENFKKILPVVVVGEGVVVGEVEEQKHSSILDSDHLFPAEAANTDSKPNTRASPEDFDRFWEIYPRREAKGAAKSAWARAVKKAGVEEILAAAKVYRDDGARQRAEARFTKLPATWLNAECWTDERPAPHSRASPASQLTEVNGMHLKPANVEAIARQQRMRAIQNQRDQQILEGPSP